jgi:hypothetical protein
MGDGGDTPFYVGYLPVPRRLSRFLWLVVVANLCFFLASAAILARTMSDPGPAVWNDGEARQFRGTFVLWPYPMLIDTAAATPSARLLVEVGKHGVDRDFSALKNNRVVASGWTLDRGGQRMIELEPQAQSLASESSQSAAAKEMPLMPTSLGVATLRGEIVDSKCYLGAMKPGDQKTHKACATLCIRGGIPPVLVERLPGGGTRCTLLANIDGGPLDPAAFDRIAEPVEMTGELEELAGIRRLRVHADAIRRL